MTNARQHYDEQLNHIDANLQTYQTRSAKMGWIRPVLFLSAVVCLTIGYAGGDEYKLLKILGWVTIVAFFIALSIHESFREKIEKYSNRRLLYQRLKSRLDRDWTKLKSDTQTLQITREFASPLTKDLDVFGDKSLFAWCNLAFTVIGKQTVARWITQTATADQIKQRQIAAQELSQAVEFREDVLKLVSPITQSYADPQSFSRWASGPAWTSQHAIAYRLSIIGPCLIGLGLCLILGGYFADVKSLITVGLAIGAIGFVINLLLSLFSIGSIHELYKSIASGHAQTENYRTLFDKIAELNTDSQLLKDIQKNIKPPNASAQQGFLSLSRLMRLVDMQRVATLYLIYLILQILFLWDFRVLHLLTRWQRRFGSAVPQWFESLGAFEAVVSAATIYYENPHWCLPNVINNPSDLINVAALKHPLIDDAIAVGNDLAITNEQPVLLVTGSNMAGKSTFLRSLGLNILLARLGSPVAAQCFDMQPYAIDSSIRVEDSLQDGVSFFMAELKRLRMIVDAAQTCQATHQPMLVLLDEILQGTNSRERQIAVVHVITSLRKLGAIIAVSTHDLELADSETLKRVSQVVHFRERFESVEGREKMVFDFVMHAGPTPTTNALKLLELVGLVDSE